MYQTEETGADKTYLLLAALKLIKDSVLFLNAFYSFQVDWSLRHILLFATWLLIELSRHDT